MKLNNIECMFDVSLGEIKRIVRDFHSEMEKGLSGRKSSLKMIPAYVERPKGNEKGNFLAIDLGGTNFRVLTLSLKGKRRISTPLSKTFTLKKRYIRGAGRELFDFIANCVKNFMNEHNMDTGAKYNIGFTFSFPVKQIGIARGVLIRWTKGFRARGVKGKDVVELFNKSLVRNGLHRAKVIALANDTVSTLVSKSYEDANCDVGVILGTGTNACYCEKLSNIAKWQGNRTSSGEIVVNIEWGNFNKLRQTPYDRRLDDCSENPGEQILEKMVSGMYLGELTGLVGRDLITKKVLFEGKHSTAFVKPNIFKTEYMSTVENDTTKNLSRIDVLLKRLGIPNSKYNDRKLLKRICARVSTRAARVSAAAVAAVITKMDSRLSRKHTIAIDGSVYEKYPHFSKRIKSALKELFRKKAGHIKLSLTKDASSKGAAIIAATVARRGQVWRGGVFQ